VKGKHEGQSTSEGQCKGKPQFVQARLFNDEQFNNGQLHDDQFNDNPLESEWVEINASGVRVENEKSFGGPWLALELVKLLGLNEFLKNQLPSGEEHVSWSLVSLILVICRLLNPSSELHTTTPSRLFAADNSLRLNLPNLAMMLCSSKQPSHDRHAPRP
jgi:hypothetical protein